MVIIVMVVKKEKVRVARYWYEKFYKIVVANKIIYNVEVAYKKFYNFEVAYKIFYKIEVANKKILLARCTLINFDAYK